MTGMEAWHIIAPMIYVPHYDKERTPQFDLIVDAYVIACIGCQLFDSWVAHGKPREWQEKPKR